MFNGGDAAIEEGFMQKPLRNSLKLGRLIITIVCCSKVLRIVGLAILLYPAWGFSCIIFKISFQTMRRDRQIILNLHFPTITY